MATTKLLNIKSSSKGVSRHLNNAIHYIMNPEKTNGGILIGGNSGGEPPEVFETMIDTKNVWEKKEGRQGYHFVISFSPGETNEQTAYRVMKEFCEEYLGESYDYVFAIHNDKEHMHGHVVFNSVNRETGFKYRYEKGDWEQKIQPVTDKICIRNGLKKLDYDKQKKKGKSYAEWSAEKQGRFTWTKIIRADIDEIISMSQDYDDFMNQMHMIGYQIKVGHSRKYGSYTAYTTPGGEQVRRDYILGDGYRIDDIKQRIFRHEKKEKHFSPTLKRSYAPGRLSGRTFLSKYQVVKVKTYYQTTMWTRKNKFAVGAVKVRKELLELYKLSAQCKFLIRNHIRSSGQLQEKKEEILSCERSLKHQQSRYYELKSNPLYVQFLQMKNELSNCPDENDRFEKLQDRLEEMEHELPAGVYDSMEMFFNIRYELNQIREEKKIIGWIEKADANAKLSQEKKIGLKIVEKVPIIRR